MAKTASSRSAPSVRPSSEGQTLAGRLLRSVQDAALGQGRGGLRRGAAGLGGLPRIAETATALQLLRVCVETMAEICAEAGRLCDRAIHTSEDDARAELVKRLEERIRDLDGAGAQAAIAGYPPLPSGAWMICLDGPDGTVISARIPGIRALGILQGLAGDPDLTGRTRLDQIQIGLSDVRGQIRDARIAILGTLQTLSDALEPAA